MKDILDIIKDILPILAGGLLSLAGSFFAIKWQAKKSLKIRMDEIIAEKKVIVNADAYKHLKNIGSFLVNYQIFNISAALDYMLKLEDWWISNRIYMTKGLPENWLKTRNLLRFVCSSKNKATEQKSVIQKSIDDAIQAIYDELGLEKIVIK